MIAILKYCSGNIKSVTTALDRLGCKSLITDNPEELSVAGKVIIPGVGEAGTAMRYLRERGLDTVIKSLRQPVLGICLGMQLMCTYSEEGDTCCLGIFSSQVKRFPPLDKVPHMGWNNFSTIADSPLLDGISNDDDMYYVHSYYADVSEQTIAVCNYIARFSAVMQMDNFFGTQFHPEKSGTAGSNLLKNFLGL
jgi:glutamine amidotransferase